MKISKCFVLTLCSIITLAGCDDRKQLPGYKESPRTNLKLWVPAQNQNYTVSLMEVCIKGVSYYLSFIRDGVAIAPQWNKEGKIVTCE